MIRIRAFSLALALALVAGPGSASAASDGERGWYGGLKVGRSGLGIAPTAASPRFSRAWNLSLGYRLDRHFTLEGRYLSPGRLREDPMALAPGADALQEHGRVRAWSLTGIGVAPLGEKWSLYGRVGLARSPMELEAGSLAAAIAPGRRFDGGSGLVLGAGAVYDFTRRVFGKAGWDRYSRIGEAYGRGDVDQLSIGVGIRF
jgi:opacity protein-like surface antigen